MLEAYKPEPTIKHEFDGYAAKHLAAVRGGKPDLEQDS